MSTRMIESQDTGKVYRVVLDDQKKQATSIEVIDTPQFRPLDENSEEYVQVLTDVILSIVRQMATQNGGNDAPA